MGLFDNLFGKKFKIKNDQDASAYNEHAVIIHFTYYKDSLDPLHKLSKKLIKVIEKQQAGFFDGHEIAMDLSDGSLYMYGANAEELYKTVKPILDEVDFLKGAVATLRFGSVDSDAKVIEVKI